MPVGIRQKRPLELKHSTPVRLKSVVPMPMMLFELQLKMPVRLKSVGLEN
jgi:hypothetical protein